MLISGGWNEDSEHSLKDAWCFDMVRSKWSMLGTCNDARLVGPALTGHRAVMSGFDLFTFGGQSEPTQFADVRMDVYALSLGQPAGEDSNAGDEEGHGHRLGYQLTSDSDSLENEEEEEDAPLVAPLQGQDTNELADFRRFLAQRLAGTGGYNNAQ